MYYRPGRAVRTCNPIPVAFATVFLLMAGQSVGGEFVGEVVDAVSGRPIPARVYLEAADGQWHFVEPAVEEGTALAYREQWVPTPQAVEKHTTVSAHPFCADLPAGSYLLTVERGKEYFPHTESFSVGEQRVRRTIRLRRWINLAERGWYSGETHVHRRVEELPNVMAAEDLNVAFPVTFWTVNAYAPPGLDPSPLRRQGPSPFGPRRDYGSDRIDVDATHVIFPRNTEYEVFFVDGKRHTLGAVFILNHKSVFRRGMPPVAEIAEQAHREGALLDLDKHNWPWSMMLIPIAQIDLYELANNSVWRTAFGFRRSSTAPAEFMNLERDDGGFSEWGWLDFGFQNYYLLLNCGFRLQPTAGTASGVHPVPLGFSRVYVHVGSPFDADAWFAGLKRGRSFVTTGPMLFAKLAGRHPGHEFKTAENGPQRMSLTIESLSERPVDRIEVIVNGVVVRTIKPSDVERVERTGTGAYRLEREVSVPVPETSWIAVRSIQYEANGRVRFAHTAPWHVTVAGKPIAPRRREVEFLIRRVRDEIERHRDVLEQDALAEFQKAVEVYEKILERARDN